MDALTITFAVATFGAVGVSWARSDVRWVALTLLALWVVDIACSAIGLSYGARFTVGVTLDTIAAIAFVIAWRIIWPPRAWLLGLALTFFAQVTAHRVFSHQLRTLQITLNVLYALQLATLVIGPRVGQIVGHARDLRRSLFSDSRDRVRPRSLLARADAALCRLGAAALREKP